MSSSFVKQSSSVPQDELYGSIKLAIKNLMKGQVSDTVILSSYKVNTAIQDYLGIAYKTELIGRKLSKMARALKLDRLQTRIPKYILTKEQFAAM